MAAFHRKRKTRFSSQRVELTSRVSANGTLKFSCMQVNSDKSKVNHRRSTKPDSSHDSKTKTLRDGRLAWLGAPLGSVDGVEV